MSRRVAILIFGFVSLFWIGCDAPLPISYQLDEIDLVPEGIAYSLRQDCFYVTSIAKSKIIKVDRKTGRQSDFISSFEYGYQPGVGIIVDEERNHLFALGGYYMSPDSIPALYHFDLHSGAFIDRYSIADEGEHFMNDMAIDLEGNLYITNTKDSSIYYWQQGSTTLELYYQSDEIVWPNGITISDDGSKLYIASTNKGVRTMDIATKELLNRADQLNISTGIDGLEYYRGNLYAVQNGISQNTDNFRKLILSEDQSEILSAEVIDSHNPELYWPLTFCIADGMAFVIANSNLKFLDQQKIEIPEPDSLKPTILLGYQLN